MENSSISIKRLINEEQCYEAIRQLRWSDKIRCPHCDSEHIIKRGRHSTQTAGCEKRFDDLIDTVLAGHFNTKLIKKSIITLSEIVELV
jgi:transposase-like protein